VALVDLVAAAEQEELLPALAAVCARLGEFSAASLDEEALREELSGCEQAARRLQARQARLVAERTRRQAEREQEQGLDPERSAARARRKVGRELRHELGWTPSQAKQAERVGREVERSPETGAAFDAGRLPPAHVRILFDTLQHLVGDERERVQAELMAAAHHQDAVEFGRTCRGRLAQLDHEAAAEAELRRHDRRSGRVTETEDGMLAASVCVAGLDKALVNNAFQAFRRPDFHGERRSPEQATADAFVEICRVALKAAVAPVDHGVRPYVSVTIPYQAVLEEAGVVEVEGAGPMPFAEVRRLLADCGVSRLLTDPRGVPVEAGARVRTVPAGLRRMVYARDGGCIADGCDAPASWCEVMHLATPYHLRGRLTPQTAALGCAEHHFKFDRRGWVITWVDGHPVLHHPRKPPTSNRGSGKSFEERSGARGDPGASPPDAPSRPETASPPDRAPPPDVGSRPDTASQPDPPLSPDMPSRPDAASSPDVPLPLFESAPSDDPPGRPGGRRRTRRPDASARPPKASRRLPSHSSESPSGAGLPTGAGGGGPG
jgi:hypothetical protein